MHKVPQAYKIVSNVWEDMVKGTELKIKNGRREGDRTDAERVTEWNDSQKVKSANEL